MAAKNSSINLIPANRPDISVEIHQVQFIEANLVSGQGRVSSTVKTISGTNIKYSRLYRAGAAL